MKNNKGFSLVELLAVIIILSIVALVIVPDTVRYLKRGENEYNDKLKGQLELSAKNYYSDYKENLPVKGMDELELSKSSYVTALELSSNNYLSKDLRDAEERNCTKQSFVKVTLPQGSSKEEWHSCLICEDENGQKNYSEEDPFCIVDEEQVKVDIIVNGGTANPSVYILDKEQKLEAPITPLTENSVGTATCTNEQEGILEGNNLIINNVTNHTICTVTYNKQMITTLYNDGTLIINEDYNDRNTNKTNHGEIINEYNALTDDNTYVFSNSSSQPWYNEGNDITDVEIGSNISPTSTAYWFYGLGNLQSGDFTKLNTSKTIDMKSMFYEAGCNSTVTSFKLIGINDWDVSNVTDMSYMFAYTGCNATSFDFGDLSGWDTSKVTDMSYMFCGTGKVKATLHKKMNLSDWNVSGVTSYSYFNSEAAWVTPPKWTA